MSPPGGGHRGGMRIVVIGATGNIGVALVRALAADDDVKEVVGVARRRPDAWHPPRTRWVTADVAEDDLRPLVEGADAVCHLAWAIQPSHDPVREHRVNVVGSERVFRATAEAGVPALLHASSVGAYGAAGGAPGHAPGPRTGRVGEDHPTHGIPTSSYSWQKAYCERLLDAVEHDHPGLRVVRLRPSIVARHGSASHLRRLFAGPLLPGALMGRLPVTPTPAGLRLQLVHADDVAAAFRSAVHADARGAFNLAAEPVLDPAAIAAALGGRAVGVPAGVARAAVDLSWRLRLQPTSAGWLDMALQAPLLDTTRARSVLGWEPRHDARSVLDEVLAGLRDGAGDPTPPLAPGAGGPARLRALATGVGGTGRARTG